MCRILVAVLICWMGHAIVTRAGAGEFSGEQIAEIEKAAAEIDRLLSESWQRDEITPVDPSGDAEFCRRVWLDLSGVAPPVSQLRRFLEDSSTDKRERLVDSLLRSPRFASHMASRWIDTLLPADVQTQAQSADNIAELHRWLQKQFLENTPYDHFVGRFLTAGGQGNSGPAIFYTSYSLQPERLAAATSRIFMGIQLQCAQCHDHPFGKWSQESFWEYAAFFGQLQQRDGAMAGQTIIEDRSGGEVMFPETERVMLPRYPGASGYPEEDPSENRRRQLTIWMASRDNPYFARAAANRAWSHMLGRGLVEPVDDMDSDNPSSHPELLKHLSGFLIEQRFDLRALYAAIGRSRAYGLTSRVAPDEHRPPGSFAAMQVKTLSPEQFYDSLQQNVFRQSAVIPSDRNSPSRGQKQQFLTRMRVAEASVRDYPHGVVQALGLMNGPEVTLATQQNSSALLHTFDAPFFDDRQRVETLFLATLSRMPSESESKRFLDYLGNHDDATAKSNTMGDLLWILINTAEYAVCP